MGWAHLCLVALALVLFGTVTASAAPPVDVPEPEISLDLVDAVELQIDARPAEAWRELAEDGWSDLPDNASVGVPGAPVWLRLQLFAKRPVQRLLQVNDLGVSSGSLVHRRPDGTTEILTYPAGRPLAERAIADPTLVFPVDLPAGPSTIWIRIETHEALLARVRLVPEATFTTERNAVWMAWAAYFGLIGGLALYNLFLGATLRDRAYLLYVLMVISTHGLLQLRAGGLLFHLLPTWTPTGLAMLGDGLVALGALGAAAFAWDFLKVPRLAPITRWMYLPLLVLCLAAPLGTLIAPALSFTSTMLLLLVAPAALVGSAIESWLRGHLPARWFLLAWSTLFIALVWTLLRALGVLPLIGFQGVELMIGSAAEATLLSIALADRIRTLKNEQRQATIDAEIHRREAAEARLSGERQRGIFLSTMSHELRTPMHQVLGLADLLIDGETSAQRREDLLLLQSCGQDLARLIDDMLLYTELRTGQSAAGQVCALDDLLADCAKRHAPRARERGLSWSATRTGPQQVWVDPRLLARILEHLVDNAVKFTEHGFVDVQLTVREHGPDGHQLHLAVTDSGPGIAPERLERLFALFHQDDAGYTRESSGAGLGLSMCRVIAQALGGDVDITDLDGAGTRAVLTIPVSLREPVAAN